MARIPEARNEPAKDYSPSSQERGILKRELERVGQIIEDIPAVVGGEELRSKTTFEIRAPFAHAHLLANAVHSSPEWVAAAIGAAMDVRRSWAATPLRDRAAVFLRAAELIAGKYRAAINAATMWGQGKTVVQSEVDAVCEGADFLRFNAAYAQQIADIQPLSTPGIWNQLDYRPLDGFVLAIAPFNFTAIGLNLATAPALMGNVVLLKPSETATLSAWLVHKVLVEAGLPPGVINFLPGSGAAISAVALKHPDFGGLHFTGSTQTFRSLWKAAAENLSTYRQYPRLVGETGGKYFIFIHTSAEGDLEAVATAIIRGGFEYQGQKCSACSRVYVPESLWKRLKERLVETTASLAMGPPTDFRNFLSAVIDERSYARIGKYLALAQGNEATVLAGGTADRSVGWFVKPTLVAVSNPRHPLMTEEIFGPIVALFAYPDGKYLDTLREADRAAPYALTGSIFARDREAIRLAAAELRGAAGNFYINDKCSGAVVGQQPFGGGRASGTNDKAGSIFNLLRWTSPRTVKETMSPPTLHSYPSMGAP